MIVNDVERDEDCEPGGYDCLEGAGVAKNILVVGALKDDGVTPANFSAFGPTDDGRIKPDIMANGVSVYSPVVEYDNNGDIITTAYDDLSGTSMAAPAVTGSIALLKQLLEPTQYHAATLKALVLHTTDDIGPPGPDYQTGWGRMNTERAAEVIQEDINHGDPLHIVDNTTLDNGETLDFTVTTTADPQPLRGTISWADPAGIPQNPQLDPNTRMLVNDLNLRVIRDSDGSITEPYVLDPLNPGSAATRGDNDVDNVEQVYIASPAPNETYTLSVSHDTPLQGFSQDFALVVTGNSTLTLPGGDDDDDDPPPPAGCLLPAEITADLTVEGTCIVDGTTVSNGATLTIEAGTELEFNPDKSLIIESGAKIIANGTSSNKIHFERGGSIAWKQVVLKSDGNIFEHVIFSGGTKTVQVASKNNTFRYCIFKNGWRGISSGSAVSGGRSSFTLEHSTVWSTPQSKTTTLSESCSTVPTRRSRTQRYERMDRPACG